jgi:hypothetical protein
MAPETFLFLFVLFVAIVLAPELISGAIVIVVAVIAGLLFFFAGMILWGFGAKININYDGRKYILRWFSLKEVE